MGVGFDVVLAVLVAARTPPSPRACNMRAALLLAALAALVYPGDGRLNFTALAQAAGLAAQEYDVQTEDYYILKLFRIPGAGPPVLLMHGLLDSADTFVLRGARSLAAHLARSGRDVWLANARGSRHARRHLYLDPERDDEFWDFSFHEIGAYDLPAVVDFVLARTGRATLSAVGHAHGNTVFYVLGATRPEYNAKIDVLVALAPTLLLNISRAVELVADAFPATRQFLEAGGEEVLGDGSAARAQYEAACGGAADACARRLLLPLAGGDVDADLPTLVRHFPAGTSRKNLLHTALVAERGRFEQFDYGPLNSELYGSSAPPEYQLGAVSMRVALLAGRADPLAGAGAAALRAGLARAWLVPLPARGHVAGVWGGGEDVYPLVDRVLDEYGAG